MDKNVPYSQPGANNECKKKLKVNAFQVHKKWHQEIKGNILSTPAAIRLILNNIISTVFETVQLEMSQLVQELIKKLLMVFHMYRRRSKQTFYGYSPEQVSGG